MLIGLHGKKSAGKDTVYERLAQMIGDAELPTAVERVSFADLLYESAARSLGVSVEYLRTAKNDSGYRVQTVDPWRQVTTTQTVRSFLQRYGTEAHRDVFGPDFWVDAVDLTGHHGRVVCVTDVRFRNEAQAVADAGGAIVHVIGPDAVENTGDGHASEEKLPASLIDLELYNVLRDDDYRALDADVAALFLRLRREGY